MRVRTPDARITGCIGAARDDARYNRSMSDPWLTAAARTVVGAAEQFDGLKATARAMDDAARARARGYFTPSEDEAVRQMLVSYSSMRAALLDLIASTDFDRRAVDADDDTTRRAFIAAYAAATVLVDGARFLRDLFDDNPVVRGKLKRLGRNVGRRPNWKKAIVSLAAGDSDFFAAG